MLVCKTCVTLEVISVVKLPPIGLSNKPIKAFCIGTHKTIHFDIINAEIRMLCLIYEACNAFMLYEKMLANI